MIFEQAFYSRNQKGGLGIYAASDISKPFLDKCAAVGGIFRMEDLNAENSAELVYYSDIFSRYVGIGITATTYEDGTGRNRIIHILVPKEYSADPSDFCLDYTFESRFEWGKKYPQLEICPTVGSGEYHTILNRYGFTTGRLAHMLCLVLPVVNGSKNQLLVVADESSVPGADLRRAAREIMWLLNVLLPAPEEERSLYRKNLSYCVHSTANTDKVNIAFVTAVPAQEPYFDLTSGSAADPAEEETPEVFRRLAEHALVSLEDYRTFLKDLFTCRLERSISRDSMDLMFLFWKLKKGEVEKLDREELPNPLTDLIDEAVRDSRYRSLLFKIFQVLNEASANELGTAYDRVFAEEVKAYKEGRASKDFVPAYCSAMRLAYARKEKHGNNKIYELYTIIPNEEMRSAVLSELWENGGEGSCIVKDISDISTVAEFAEKAERYISLKKNAQFVGDMKQILLEKEKGLYFLMDKEQREFAASWLDSTDGGSKEKTFADAVREKATALFQESPEQYSKFLEKEIDCVEPRFVPLYFCDLVDKCGQAEDDDARKLLQKTGHHYLKQFDGEIHEGDVDRFNKIDSEWRRNDIKRRLQGLSLEKLAGFRDFQADSEEERKDFYALWYDEVLRTVREQGRAKDDVLDELVDRRKELEVYVSASQLMEYEEALWNLCGDNLSQRVYCSAHMDPQKYRIWSVIPVFHIDEYVELKDHVRNKRQICTVSIPDYPEDDFNRDCFCLWESVDQDERIDNSNLYRLWGYAQSHNSKEEWDRFLKELMETIRKRKGRISLQTCSNYLDLYYFLYQESTGSQRCAHYAELRQKYAPFYRGMLDIESCTDLSRGGAETVRKLSEIRLFERLISATPFAEASLPDRAALLFAAEEQFGQDVQEIVDLRKECDDKTMELKEKKKKFEESIRKNTDGIEQNNICIRQNLEKIESLRKQIAEMESDNQYYQGCIENDKEQLAGIEEILRQAECAQKGQIYVPQTTEEVRRTDVGREQEKEEFPLRHFHEADNAPQVSLHEEPSHQEVSLSGQPYYGKRRAEEEKDGAGNRGRSVGNDISPSDRREYRDENHKKGRSSQRKKSRNQLTSDPFSSALPASSGSVMETDIVVSEYEVSFPVEL